jgi:preprotein translocase subunit SecE
MLQRQGTVDADGAPVAQRRPAPAARPQEKEKRTTAGQFVKEVRSEMRKVAWPTRPEVVNYSVIVLLAVVLLTAFVAGLDYLFGEFVLKLYSQ